jgi:hypothetical protein
LWKNPRYGNDEDVVRKLLWHYFQNVIILDKQRRYLEDPPFADFLMRTRQAALTEGDTTCLNSRVICLLTDPVLEVAWIEDAQI